MKTSRIVDVGIICANYNNGKYLDDFFSSIISSSFLPREVILVDDGSTDNSVKKLREYDFEGLKVIELERNVGFANALNVAIDAVTANYILRVDPDDILHPRRIEKQWTYLMANGDIDIIGSNVSYFKSSPDEIIGRSNFPLNHSAIRHRYLAGEHGLLHGSIMGKTSFFKIHKYVQSNVPAEDYDIFARMIESGAQAHNLSEILTFVRIHANSVSNFLPYSTVQKTYSLRDSIFGSKTSLSKIWLNYISLKFYRMYYFEDNAFKKCIFLIISALFRPDKALKKLFNGNK